MLATKFNGIEGLIPLHGGLPPASAFPLTALQLTLKDGTKVDIAKEEEASASTFPRLPKRLIDFLETRHA